MNDKDPKSPATTSFAHDAMSPRWEKIDAVLGGTETMRMAGQDMMPMHTEEGDSAYSERLNSAVLLNLTELTLESWVGRPFSDPVAVEDDVPEVVKELLNDVDLQGNNISVFSRNWFRDGTAKSFSHVLVDFPRPREITGRPRTLEDDRNENIRPYWVNVLPENLIFAHSTIIDGVEVLDHIRIKEEVVSMSGFTEVVTQRIRQMDLIDTFDEADNFVKKIVQVTLWEKKRTGKSKKVEWVQEEVFDTDIDEIPLVTFYSNKTGFMSGKSPLIDLADLNIRWWQSNSDQIAILTVARFPILAASGVSDTNDMVVGPHNWLGMDAPNGRFYYVEHEGKAIGAGDTDLKNLEDQMANYGADFLKKRPGNQTATARALDSAEATSPLQDAALRFQDSLGEVLRLTAKWMNVSDGGGTARIITDYGPESPESVHATLIQFARKGRDLSRVQFLKLMKTFGSLPDNFSFDENETELEDELVSFAPPTKNMDPNNPGNQEPDPKITQEGDNLAKRNK